MAAPEIASRLHVPGRLVRDPTDLTAAFPHGGVALGSVKDLVVRPSVARVDVRAEEWGAEVVEQIYAGSAWVMVGILRNFDEDAVAKIFPNVAAGATSGKNVVKHPGSNAAGTLRGGSSVKLLFVPDDTDRHRMVYFRKALPLVEEALEMSLSLARPLEVAFAFIAIRPSSGEAAEMALKEDLTL